MFKQLFDRKNHKLFTRAGYAVCVLALAFMTSFGKPFTHPVTLIIIGIAVVLFVIGAVIAYPGRGRPLFYSPESRVLLTVVIVSVFIIDLAGGACVVLLAQMSWPVRCIVGLLVVTIALTMWQFLDNVREFVNRHSVDYAQAKLCHRIASGEPDND